MKPVALIIVGPDGDRLEPIRGAASSVVGKVAEAITSTTRGARGKTAD